MTRKRTLSFFLGFLLLCALFPVIILYAQASDSEIWALIVHGSIDSPTFYRDTRYMYKVLNEDYGVSHDNIIYLSTSYPNTPYIVDDSSTLDNVRTAINTTLANSVGVNDIVFMYFSSHGGGYNGTYLCDGVWDEPPFDEGNEHMVDGNWKGCDERIQVWVQLNPYVEEWYSDDNLTKDLNCINCAKLIFVRQGCVEGNQSCFGGGLIDDISGPKRIIMSASNETGVSYGDMDVTGEPGYGFSEWSERFIDALHGKRARWDTSSNNVVEVEDDVTADTNNDTHTSMWEAWKWAWDHDEARLANEDSPWLDDDNNSKPTYADGKEYLDPSDGLFSMETYFGFDNLKTPDINEDCVVNVLDMTIVSNAFGSDPDDPNWNELADLNNDGHVNILDITIVGVNWGKLYSDPPSPVSMKTILFMYPVWTIVRKDETFSVNVVLFNVNNLQGWEFELYWNNIILKCTSAEAHVPDVWSENIFEAGPGIENDFNATHGRCWMAMSALYPAPSFNGSVVIVTLNFEAIASGSTMLDLQETILADNEAHVIPHTSIDSAVIVRER